MADQVHQSPIGKIVFGTIQEPRLNQYNNKLEWSLGLVFDMKTAQVLIDIADQALKEAAKRSPKVAAQITQAKLPYKPAQILQPDGTKLPDPDNLLFTFKRNATRMVAATGEEARTSAPIIYGSDGAPLTSFNKVIGRETTGSVVFKTYVYDKFSVGCQFQIEGFQISELNEGGSAPATLAPIAGNVTNETESLSILDGEEVLPPL
tara:strand:+ start:1080 stop:1697 length:618 start_codon:yes stop_codon:yes gene_type:complete